MKPLFSLVLLSIGLGNVHSLMTCGRSSNRGGKIVGGEKARIGEFPWQVLLKRYGNQICGGSILSENFVVTAAHCVKNDPSIYSVGYGSLRKYDFLLKESSVSSVHIHPGWQPTRALSNDIALLKLSDPIKLNEKTAAPVCLPPPGYTPSGHLKVSGWGRTREGGSTSQDLMFTAVPVIPDKQCSSRYGVVYNATSMFCAMQSGGGKDSCQGDSGGPAVIRHEAVNYLAGVVSWGEGCARSGAPGVYTRVSTFTPWIESVLQSFGTDEDLEQIRSTLNEETLASIKKASKVQEPYLTTTSITGLISEQLPAINNPLPGIQEQVSNQLPSVPQPISDVASQVGGVIGTMGGNSGNRTTI